MLTLQRLCLLLVGSSLLLACEETGPRVYTAQLFHENDAGGCLDVYTPIGLVEADELHATCEPACLEQDGALYVSTVCAPYPSTAVQVSADDSSACRAALALVEAGDAACQ